MDYGNSIGVSRFIKYLTQGRLWSISPNIFYSIKFHLTFKPHIQKIPKLIICQYTSVNALWNSLATQLTHKEIQERKLLLLNQTWSVWLEIEFTSNIYFKHQFALIYHKENFAPPNLGFRFILSKNQVYAEF